MHPVDVKKYIIITFPFEPSSTNEQCVRLGLTVYACAQHRKTLQNPPVFRY